MRFSTAAGVALVVAAAAAFAWIAFPRGGPCARAGDCASCHAGSAPSTHTADYVGREHGHAALRERASCLGCHKKEECADCHRKRRPEWHTDPFRFPSRGRAERDEHARLAVEHRAACAECHAPRFKNECAACHRPDEDWMRAEEERR